MHRKFQKHTQIQEIIADLKDKKQKHVSKHKPIPFMSLWFIKGRSQVRASPSREDQHRLYIDITQNRFLQRKKIADSCSPEYSYRANQKSIQATNKAMFL